MTIRFSPNDKIYYSKVNNARDLILLGGRTPYELVEDFKVTINDYLEFCNEVGIIPNQPIK